MAAFAARLAERPEASAAAFEGLLLAAPPHFLGHLRASLGDAARAKLRGAICKDLTHAPLAQLAEQLDAISRG